MSPEGASYESILDTVGATAVVRLSRIPEAGAAAIHVKLEHLNPGGSVMDRAAWAMLERAEEHGWIQPGGTVIEATTGSTGISLALACAVKGYRLIVTMPESMSLERRALLTAYGARVELTPASLSMEGALARARALAAETPGAYLPNQFENPANPEAHAETTARELVETVVADGGRIDAFVAGVGTGGTVTGVGRVLKARFPGVRIAAVEPRGSAVLSGGRPGPHGLQGLGVGFVPLVLDRAVIDRILPVEDREAWAMKDRLAREEGILVGVSSGAAVYAALVLARELGPGQVVYTLCSDTGERYFSLAEHFQ